MWPLLYYGVIFIPMKNGHSKHQFVQMNFIETLLQ